jgi:hypothetical protein
LCEDRVGLPRRCTPCEDRRSAEGITASGTLASGRRDRSAPDVELVTLATGHARHGAGHAGFASEAKWLRHALSHLRHLFPYLPKQPGCNKRLRKAAELLRRVTGVLATDTSIGRDDVWTVDSTPVECGRSRETVKPSDLAGWAEYGY